MKIDLDKYFLKTYKRYNITFVKGEGKYLYDINGRKYLDFFSGLSVNNLGHCNKKIVSIVSEQLKKLWHISNFYYNPAQVKLAELIIKKTFPGKIFFSNSGAEANECAIKIVRKIGSTNGKCEIISFKNSFHGRTLATLAATGQEKFHKGYSPLPEGFKYAEFNEINSVKKLITKKTIAIIVEPVQGEGGVIPAKKEFLVELRKLCDEHNLILIFDEIQTGFGRTGKLFAYQYYGVKPDILTLAKSISNGLPLGATVVDKKYADVFTYGDHGSTFGGNILSCTAGIEVIKQINKKLLVNVSRNGKYFYDKLFELKSQHRLISEIRGVGLMLGVVLNTEDNSIGRKIVEDCLYKGLVINVTQDKVLRFLPPLIITKTDIDFCIKVLHQVLSKYENI